MQDPFSDYLNDLLSGNFRNIFYICLKDYRVLIPQLLYGDFGQMCRELAAEINSNLYVISRIPRMRFEVEKCRIGFNLNVVGRLRSNNGKEYKFNASMAKFWHEAPTLCEFPSEADLARHFLEVQYEFKYFNFLPPNLKYKLLSRVNKRLSSGSKLVVDCVLSWAITNLQERRIGLYPHRIANLCSLDIGEYPEVLYVGISHKNVFSRLEKHSKLQEILALNDDDHEIVIHFLSLENSLVQFGPSDWKTRLHLRGTNSRISLKDQTEMAETVLINYFKPEFNEKKTKQELIRNGKIKKNLIRNGYTDILCELQFDGRVSKLGSRTVRCSNTHLVNYSLTTS